MKWVFLFLIVSWTTLQGFSQNTEKTIFEQDIPWLCMENDSIKLTENKILKVLFKSAEARNKPLLFDVSEFVNLIKKSETPSYSPFDYSPCFKTFLETMVYLVKKSIFENKIKNSGFTNDILEEKFSIVSQKLEKYIKDYSAKTITRKTILPFKPGQLLSPEFISSWNANPLFLGFKSEFCSMSPQVNSDYTKYLFRQFYTSENYISSHLPRMLSDLSSQLNAEEKNRCIKNLKLIFISTFRASLPTTARCEKPEMQKFCVNRSMGIAKAMELIQSKTSIQFFPAAELPNLARNPSVLMENLLSLEANQGRTFDCTDLQPLESKVISGDQGTGLESAYLLTRLTDENNRPTYQVSLNLEFLPERLSDYTAQVAREKTQEYVMETNKLNENYRKRVETCLKESVNTDLRGPNGERLEIALLPRGSKSAPKSPIEVSSTTMRSHSRKWSPEVSCSTIIHELFHLMGLVDEYKETSSGYKTEEGIISYVSTDAKILQYDCRAIGPSNSIMSLHWNAFNSLKTDVEELTFCYCPNFNFVMSDSAEGRCEEMLAKLDASATTCPSPTKTTKVQYEKMDSDPQYQLFKNMKDQSAIVHIIVKDPDPTSVSAVLIGKKEKGKSRTSLLYPAHYRSIVHPGCNKSNEVFYSCSREAYKTSVANYGTDTCLSLPECNVPTEWIK